MIERAKDRDNRMVNPDGKGNAPISEIEISQAGRIVHLRGFGFAKLFRTVSRNRDEEYWVTNDLEMEEKGRASLEKQGWGIEVYHRAIKQCCEIEKSYVRKAVSIIKHISLSLGAFLRLEIYRLRKRISWYEARLGMIIDAIPAYLTNPIYEIMPIG